MQLKDFFHWQQENNAWTRPFYIDADRYTDEDKLTFFSKDINRKQHIMEAATKGVWGIPELEDIFSNDRNENKPILMPPRKGHIAMMMAAGELNNAVITNKKGEKVLLKGQSRKITRDTKEVGRYVERDAYETKLHLLNLHTGQLEEVV